MAAQGMYFAESFKTLSDLSAYPQRFVKIDSAGLISMASAGTYPEGVLENLPSISFPASISFVGITKVAVDAAYPIGTYLMAGTNGIGTEVTAGAYMYTRAKMLEASGASGDIVMIRLVDDVVGSAYTGSVGAIGATGVKGVTGIQGVTGVGYGLTGMDGVQGITGSNGIQGITGENGTANVSSYINVTASAFGGVTGINISDWVYCVVNGTTGVLAWYTV